MALLLVIFTTGDTIVTWLVAHIAPGLLPGIEAMAPVVRLMLFGGVPAAIVAIWGLVATRGRPAKHR